MTEKEIFLGAVEKKGAAERERYLSQACGPDDELKKRLEALLAAHEQARAFLEEPAAPPAPTELPPVKPITSDPMLGALFADRYKIREKLGEGGMGTVYVADQIEPVQRRVALKLIRGDYATASVLARFEQERQALALMDHPNIAKVFDAGVAQYGERRSVSSPVVSTPYFVMELIKGVPITKYCDEAKLTPKERLELFIPVCQAVQHAHQKGIIHRDLKPSNILIGLYDGRPVPKVIDFGVAKATGPKLTDQSVYTEVGSLIGTLEYMSPEQAELNNLDIDTRTDIYALGIILYELLTGMVPFSQKEFAQAGLVQMLIMIKEVEPPKPSTKLSHSGSLPSVAAMRKLEPKKLTNLIKGDLDWIVMKSLEKDRNRRYETANALATDITRYLSNETVLAGRPGSIYRFQKFIRRNKAAALVALVIVTSVVASSAILAWGLLRAIDAESRAVAEGQKTKDALGIAKLQTEKAVEERKEKEAALGVVSREKDAKDAALVRSDGLRLGAEATLIRTSNPGLSMLLGLEAVKRYPHHLTYDALFGAAAECREVRTISIKDHDPRILRMSHDRKRLLTAGTAISGRGTVVIWDVQSAKPLVTWEGYGPGLGAVVWSPDDRKIAVTTTGDLTINYEDGQTPRTACFTNRVAYVFDSATGKDIFHLRKHDSRVVSVRFSPDGKKIVTASWDKTAKIWDADDGRLLHTLAGHQNSLLDASFSPDGNKVMTLISNQSKPVRNYGQTSISLDPGIITRKGSVGGYSGDGQPSFSIGGMKNPFAKIWDAQTGKLMTELKKKSSSIIGALFDQSVDFSPQNAWFIEGGEQIAMVLQQGVRLEDNSLGFWNAQAGGFEVRSLSPEGTVRMVMSPSRRRVAVGIGDGTHQIMDVQTGKVLYKFHNKGAVVQRFSTNESLCLLRGLDQSYQVWDIKNGKEVAAFRGHHAALGADFHPDGKTLITLGDQMLRYWSLVAIPQVARAIPTLAPDLGLKIDPRFFTPGATVSKRYVVGERNVVMRFHSSGKSLFLGTDDGQAAQWDILNGKPLAVTDFPVGGLVSHGEFNPSTEEMTIASNLDYPVDLVKSGNREPNLSALFTWNPQTGKVGRPLKMGNEGIRYFQYSPDRGRIMVVSNGRYVELAGKILKGFGSYSDKEDVVSIWDARSGARICSLVDRTGYSALPQWSLDGKNVLICPGYQSWLGWYDAATGQLSRKLEVTGDTSWKRWQHAFLTPDGKHIVARTNRSKAPLHFWNAATNEYLGASPELDSPTGARIEVSPRSDMLAITDGRYVHLIDFHYRRIWKTLSGHEKQVNCMVFSADGQFLLTGSEDASAALWNTQTGKLVHVFKGHPEGVLNVAYSPTGTHIATQSTDQVVRVWPVDLLPLFQGRMQREFSAEEKARYELVPTVEK